MITLERQKKARRKAGFFLLGRILIYPAKNGARKKEIVARVGGGTRATMAPTESRWDLVKIKTTFWGAGRSPAKCPVLPVY